jgi:hypothetical protein
MMVSARKRAADRANARRHGLSSMLERGPAPDGEIEALAQQIVGSSGDPERLVLARRIAQAEIELRRVRRLLTPRLATAMDQLAGTFAAGLPEPFAAGRPEHARVGPVGIGGCAPSPTIALARLDATLDELRRLERYEQRACSRRATAVRAWDAVIARQTPMFERRTRSAKEGPEARARLK